MAQWSRVHLLIQEMRVRSVGWEDVLEHEIATDSSILAWEIPWTEEPGGLYSPWDEIAFSEGKRRRSFFQVAVSGWEKQRNGYRMG